MPNRQPTGIQALERLRAGNGRFVQGVLSLDSLLSHARPSREQQARAQWPFAVVLGCSDSRAPAEFIFDQGLGDLFVIRVAGNIAAPSQIGSIEFAVARFGVPLVVVMGHSNCGAVQATLEHLSRPSATTPGLRSIVDRIRPALADLVDSCVHDDPEALMHAAVRTNVRATVNQLAHSSALLESLSLAGQLLIVGAEYSLDTGAVDFFEGVPADAGSSIE